VTLLLPELKESFGGKLARRFAFYVIITSTMITVLTSSYQIYANYLRDLSNIETRLEEINLSQLDSISLRLWNYDEEGLGVSLKSLFVINLIKYVEIRDNNEKLASLGDDNLSNAVRKKFPLIHSTWGVPRPVGELIIHASLDQVYQHVYDQALLILFTNAVKTFIVAGFILLIFHRLVAQHLNKIARFRYNLTPSGMRSHLQLDRKSRAGDDGDELDEVVTAINDSNNSADRAIVAQKKSDAALSMSEAVANSGHWSWNISTQEVVWSKQCFKIFGRDPDTWVPTGENFRLDMPPEDQKGLEDANLEGIKSGKPFVVEYNYFRGGLRDQPRRILASCDFLRDESGQITEMVGFVQDITERKEIEQTLIQSQKMEAVGQLTGGIAHDFNNMLGVIMGNLDLLRRKVIGDAKAMEYVEGAYAGSKRGANITKKLLGFSRGEGGKRESTNVNNFIMGMENLIAKSLTPKISVETILADNIWVADIDPGEFENSLLNLSLNASDAMPDGGTLTFETFNKVLDKHYVQLTPGSSAGEYVMISVSDTGTGMAPDVAEQIFQPFFTTKDAGHGTGLGLSMVYGFVQRSGGHIKVYSEPENGSSFNIYLRKR